ncbi:cytochrome c oxidase assembly protein [Limnochorda pilosa]|uniref:Membrane protein n=1 Tax=Limnochorda pilosa TaxID=1555112 RepID=A0A0K2SHT0_LIMPI|nr:cytochrome c oxidase assembly protein [Limnochorda pilosa]BAS26648.1 membrane protein [Limnochorda pilosa]
MAAPRRACDRPPQKTVWIRRLLPATAWLLPGPVLAHGVAGPARTATLGWGDWSLDPMILLGLALAVASYERVRRRFPVRAGRAYAFWAGLVILFLAWESPLDQGGERYLFTLHMVQHVLTMSVAPVLLVLGLPPGFTVWLSQRSRLAPRVRALLRPLPAFLLFAGNFAVWHVPSPYEAALVHPGVHAVQHLLYLALGLLFWSVVLAPGGQPSGISEGTRILMLFGANVANWAVSFPLAIAEEAVYAPYRLAPRLWGLSPVADQALGSGIMWMMGHMTYGIPMVLLLLRWLRRELRREPVVPDPGPAPEGEPGHVRP